MLHSEKLILVCQALFVLIELVLQAFPLLVEHILALKEHIVVETKLLLVQLVHSFHVFHALFQDLHFSLKLDLLLSLLVGILSHHFFEVFCIVRLQLLSLGQVLCLDVFVLVEKGLYLVLVSLENSRALTIKVVFNCSKLCIVVLPHFLELRLHTNNKIVNVFGHLLDGFDVVTVFGGDLPVELLNELFLVVNDFDTSSFLRLDVLLEKFKSVTNQLALTSASSLQSSFSSNSCQFQSISTFFLCD